jgi:hypothetical protein
LAGPYLVKAAVGENIDGNVGQTLLKYQALPITNSKTEQNV